MSRANELVKQLGEVKNLGIQAVVDSLYDYAYMLTTEFKFSDLPPKARSALSAVISRLTNWSK